MMEGIGLNYKKRNVTWYSLRHFGITCRLRANGSIFDVSSIAGTSVSNIEKHYGHTYFEIMKAAALKNFTTDKDGVLERD